MAKILKREELLGCALIYLGHKSSLCTFRCRTSSHKNCKLRRSRSASTSILYNDAMAEKVIKRPCNVEEKTLYWTASSIHVSKIRSKPSVRRGPNRGRLHLNCILTKYFPRQTLSRCQKCYFCSWSLKLY